MSSQAYLQVLTGYRFRRSGFKTIIRPDIILNVQDALSINFTLPIGAVLETVTVLAARRW